MDVLGLLSILEVVLLGVENTKMGIMLYYYIIKVKRIIFEIGFIDVVGF